MKITQDKARVILNEHNCDNVTINGKLLICIPSFQIGHNEYYNCPETLASIMSLLGY